jgi:NitT/TauT family transport system substrate-binding protein
MVRTEFAEERPDLVAKILTAWLRGIGFMKNPNKREEAVKYLFQYYAESNVVLSDSAVQQEFALRPLFGLDQQLKLMDRSDGSSEVDGWYNELAQFLDSSGVIQGIPQEDSYITDKFLKMIDEDADLRKFAHLSDEGMNEAPDDSAAWMTSCWLSLAAGLVVGTLLL